jgi:hypothetical protein
MLDESSSSCCLLLVIPLDVWSAILDFLQVSDLYGLVATNKELHSMVDQEGVYQRLAKRKFPIQFLDITQYDNSWKQLLQDDNAKNGYYRLELNAVSYCSREGIAWGMFYVNKIRSIAWDRQENHIILEIEAFGENDLRTAPPTSIFRLDPENGVGAAPVHLPHMYWRSQQPAVDPPPLQVYQGGDSHQLCRIHLDAAWFPPGYSYKFTYNGSRSTRGRSDYDCITFLSKHHFPSLPELFDLQREVGEGGQLGRCEFVSRSAPLVPSNVMDWKGVMLPQDIKERHCRGEWGALRPPK